LQSSFSLAKLLLTDSTFHKESLDRLGLLKPRSLYQEAPFLAESPAKSQPLKHLGLEFFSLLRSGLDLRVEFDNSEELRRYREGYLIHVLDYVL
jgi:hypothetical protein